MVLWLPNGNITFLRGKMQYTNISCPFLFNPNSIGVKYPLIALGGGNFCLCFDLLFGQKMFILNFELKL